MMNIKTFLAILALFALSSCATSPSQRARNNAVDSSNQYVKKLNECSQRNSLNESNQYVRKNIVATDKNKFELISSNEKLNDEMKKHFISYLNDILNCRNEVKPQFDKLPIEFKVVVKNNYSNFDEEYVNLLNQKITIGEFNQRRDRMIKDGNETISKVRKGFDGAVMNDKTSTTVTNKPTSSASSAIGVSAVCAFTSNPALCISSAINATDDVDTKNQRLLDRLERDARADKFDKIMQDGRLRDLEMKAREQENKKSRDELLNFKTKSNLR